MSMHHGMEGGDPDDMDRVAKSIDSQREHIEQALKDLEARVHGLIPNVWNGPDADHFVGDFNSDIKPQFDKVIDELEQSAEELRRNAEEQRRTSAS